MVIEFETILTTDPGFDYFIVEVWYNNNLIAIVDEKNEVQLYGDKTNKAIFESCEFVSVLEKARKRLNIV